MYVFSTGVCVLSDRSCVCVFKVVMGASVRGVQWASTFKACLNLHFQYGDKL